MKNFTALMHSMKFFLLVQYDSFHEILFASTVRMCKSAGDIYSLSAKIVVHVLVLHRHQLFILLHKMLKYCYKIKIAS